MDIQIFLLCWAFFLCTGSVFISVCMLLNFYDMGRFYWKFGKPASIIAILFSIPFLFCDTAVWFALIFIACSSYLLAANYRHTISAVREAGQATTILLKPNGYKIAKKGCRDIMGHGTVWEKIPDCNTIFADGNNVIYMMQYALEDNKAEWELLCHHIKEDDNISYWACLEPLRVTRNTSYLRIIYRILCFTLSIAFLAVASLQESIRATQVFIESEVIVGNSNLMLSILGVLLIIGCVRLGLSRLTKKTTEI